MGLIVPDQVPETSEPGDMQTFVIRLGGQCLNRRVQWVDHVLAEVSSVQTWSRRGRLPPQCARVTLL